MTSANDIDDTIPDSKQTDVTSEIAESFAYAQVDKSLLHPGELD